MQSTGLRDGGECATSVWASLVERTVLRVSDLTGRRVLVVGINYDPEHTGIAPYTTQACEYLRAQGAEVQVLTGVPHYPNWTIPAPYRRRMRSDESHRGIPVRRLRHLVPRRQSAVKRSTYEVTFGLHVLLQRLPWRPDVVLTVVPSLLGAAAAAAIARRHNARLVVWVQDLIGPATAQSGIAGGKRITGLTTNLEQGVLRRADKVLVLSGAFQRYARLAGVQEERIEVVRNWSHVEEHRGDRQRERKKLGWADDDVIALHAGNMGLKQGLENVVRAAELAAEHAPEVRFVLLGDGSQRKHLEALGKAVPALQFLPPATAEAYPEILAAADVLLVNERASAIDMSLPSKLTSYFTAGGPVVGAVPTGGETAREIEASGAGVVVAPDEPWALLDAVRKLAVAEVRDAYAEAAREHVERHLSSAASLAQVAEAVAGPRT